MKRHSAGSAHYEGDLSSIVGELKGPTTYGSFVVAETAEYDAEQDRTTVKFGHVTPDDLGHVTADEHGVRRLDGAV